MEILNLPLSRSTVDRAAHIRSDATALESAWQSASIIHFNGSEFLTRGTGLAILKADQVSGVGERIFLGEREGDFFFLWCSETNIGADEEYKTLREISSELSNLEIGLAVHGQAVALCTTRALTAVNAVFRLHRHLEDLCAAAPVSTSSTRGPIRQ